MTSESLAYTDVNLKVFIDFITGIQRYGHIQSKRPDGGVIANSHTGPPSEFLIKIGQFILIGITAVDEAN
jgi:hypothetical protein